MATYAQLQRQIAQLQQQAEKLQQKERAETIAKLRETIAGYAITADELFGEATPARRKAPAKKGKAAKRPGPGVPKYRDPKTGKTWTGTGKPPGWIAGARDRTKFLIDQPTDTAEPSATSQPRAVRKSSSKAAATPAARGKGAAGPRKRPTSRAAAEGAGGGPVPATTTQAADAAVAAS